jgi:hypothetical protein
MQVTDEEHRIERDLIDQLFKSGEKRFARRRRRDHQATQSRVRKTAAFKTWPWKSCPVDIVTKVHWSLRDLSRI